MGGFQGGKKKYLFTGKIFAIFGVKMVERILVGG